MMALDPLILPRLITLQDIPTNAPATITWRTTLDFNYWSYVWLDNSTFSQGAWWSDGSELGVAGTPDEIVEHINREALEWRILS